MARYSVEIRDNYGRLVTVIQRPMNKQFSVYRNRPGSCQFTMDMFDPQATETYLKLNQYDVVFRREGTPVFAGQISYIDPEIDGDNKKVDIIATGYGDLLDQRYIYPDLPNYDAAHDQLAFSNVDSGMVAWDLITYSQFPLSQDGQVNMQGTSPTLYQSFISPGSANLKMIKLLLQNTTATGNLIVGIYTDAGGAPGSLVANSQVTIPVSGISSTLGWYEIDYTTNLPQLTNGSTYWIRAYLDTAQSGSNGISWSYLNNNYYLNGKAYSPENPSLFTTGQDLQFFILLDDNSYQQTKNTYLGFLQGNIQTSFNISPIYSRYKKLKDSIESIANTYNGMDFNFTVSIDANNNMTKYFNVFYPRQGIDNTNLNFTYPGNIIKLGKPKDGKTMVNEVAERGQGYGKNQVVVVVNDASSIQTYTQRQDVDQAADVPDSGTLTLLGDEFIRVRKDPLDLPSITLDGNQSPHIGDFGVGDQIFVDATGVPILNFSQIYRIEQIDVTIDDDDKEAVQLTVSLA